MFWRLAFGGLVGGLILLSVLQLTDGDRSVTIDGSLDPTTLAEIQIPDFAAPERATSTPSTPPRKPAGRGSGLAPVSDVEPASGQWADAVTEPEGLHDLESFDDPGPVSEPETGIDPADASGQDETSGADADGSAGSDAIDQAGEPGDDPSGAGDPGDAADADGAPASDLHQPPEGVEARPNQPLDPSSVNMPRPMAVGVRQVDEHRLFVDPVHGNDDASGLSESDALGSLATAFGRVQPGTTLLLMSGDYDETMAPGAAHYLLTTGGTADGWVRITAAPGHRPVIIGSSLPAVEVRADYVELSNLTVEGRGYNVDNSWGVGLAARDSHHVVFSGNDVSGFALAGINTIRSSDVSVLGNRVYGNAFYSPNQGSGISLWSSKNHPGDTGINRIVGNLVYENENRVESGRWPGLRTDGNGIIVD